MPGRTINEEYANTTTPPTPRADLDLAAQVVGRLRLEHLLGVLALHRQEVRVAVLVAAKKKKKRKKKKKKEERRKEEKKKKEEKEVSLMLSRSLSA